MTHETSQNNEGRAIGSLQPALENCASPQQKCRHFILPLFVQLIQLVARVRDLLDDHSEVKTTCPACRTITVIACAADST